MKKLLVIAIFCLFTFASGFLLCACGSSKHKLTFSYDNSLISLKVTVDGEEVDATSNQIVVGDNADVLVEVYANAFAVDLSNVTLKVNKKSQDFFLDHDYDLTADQNQRAGKFLLPKVTKNMKINLSGVEIKTAKFKFECDSIDENQEKLKSMSLNTEGETYVNFYDFLKGENPTLERKYDRLYGEASSYRSVNFRFDDVDIYDLTKTDFFKVTDGNNLMFSLRPYLQDDVLNLSYNDIIFGDEFLVEVDMSLLEYKNFKLSLPKDNLTFSLTSDKTSLNYAEGATLTFEPKMENSQADYDGVQIFVNDFELTSKTEKENGMVEYSIPTHLTPKSTGGEGEFQVFVSGIAFADGVTHKLDMQVDEGMENLNHIKTNFGVISNEEIVPFSFGADGKQEVLSGRNVTANWKYDLMETEGLKYYHLPFKLYDYGIFANGKLITNLTSHIPNSQADEFGQDVNVSIPFENDASDGVAPQVYNFTLNAKFNSQTNCYDDFTLSFNIMEDIVIELKNFVLVEQKVALGYENSSGIQISSVEYYITSDDGTATEWVELSSGVLEQDVMLKYGQKVYFLVTSNEQISVDQIIVPDLVYCSDVQFAEMVVDEEYQLQIECTVADNFWDFNSQACEFKIAFQQNEEIL